MALRGVEYEFGGRQIRILGCKFWEVSELSWQFLARFPAPMTGSLQGFVGTPTHACANRRLVGEKMDALISMQCMSESVGRCACLATMVFNEKKKTLPLFLVYRARAWLHGALTIKGKIEGKNGRTTSG